MLGVSFLYDTSRGKMSTRVCPIYGTGLNVSIIPRFCSELAASENSRGLGSQCQSETSIRDDTTLSNRKKSGRSVSEVVVPGVKMDVSCRVYVDEECKRR